MAPPLHTTRFTLAAHVYQPTPEVEGEVYASIDRLKGLLPPEIDPAAHPTLLFVAGNLFVGGTMNRNGDAVTLEDTLRMYEGFEWQQIDIEHNRGSVVGFIVKAGLSEYGTDRLITEDEARAAGQPVNVAIIVALWKVVDRELVQYILESAIPGSPTKDDLSLSFEVGFDDYAIITLPKGVINLTAVTRRIESSAPDYKVWDKRLRVNKGPGEWKGETVGRVLVWPIIPMGGGIVGMPAAAVKGITPIVTAEPEVAATEADAGTHTYSSTQCTLAAADAELFLQYAASIPDDHLYEKEDDYGREHEPHVTALYGIKGNDAEAVRRALKGCGPITATLGKVSAFSSEDKPYEVIKVDVHGDDIRRVNALLKASLDHEDTWPIFPPHATIAYVRKGVAASYIGDTRFEGKTLTFNSITWSPAEGSREEILLDIPTVPPLPSDTPPVSTETAAQTSPDLVYSPADPSDLGSAMASSPTPTRTLKLSAGWQTKLAELQAAAGDKGLPAGIDVTLSDGRVIKAAKVIDAATLGTDIECSYDGCVITSMTPGVAAPEYVPPGKTDVYPVNAPAGQANDAKLQAQREAGQHAGYTGASVSTTDEVVAAFARVDSSLARSAQSMAEFASQLTNTASAGVSITISPSTTPQSMDLNTLKQAVAAVKTVEDIPQVMANVAAFVDAITKASEEQVAARKASEAAQQTAQTTLSEVQARLETLTTQYNALINAQQIAAAEQAFQTRMEAIEQVFAFDDETRADIVAEVKALADDAAFAAWMPRAKRLYKGYLKAAQTAAAVPPKKDDDEDDKTDKCKAAAQTALASAATNVIDAPVHNTVTLPETQSLKDRYAAILAKHTTIGGEKITDLEARSKTVKKTR